MSKSLRRDKNLEFNKACPAHPRRAKGYASRAENVEFTQPYYRADLGILSHARYRNIWQTIKPFLSRSFLLGLLFLVGALTIVGGLIWLAERKANPDEFPGGVAGLGNGMWFAIVTMTTVGYGDRSPKTTVGRLLSAIWMLFATISFSTLTAGIATALTFATLTNTEISQPSQLRAHNVAVVEGTTGDQAVDEFGAIKVSRDTFQEAVSALVEDEAEAVVFDYPALRYYLRTHELEHLKLSETHFKEQDYGFAVQLDEKDFVHRLDVALLSLMESGKLQDLEKRWLEG